MLPLILSSNFPVCNFLFFKIFYSFVSGFVAVIVNLLFLSYNKGMSSVKIVFYKTSTGKEPFSEWLYEQDVKIRVIVRTRLSRVSLGNWGDCKPIKNAHGICELRINFGAGYRVYFGRKGLSVIVLLLGGDKGSQRSDIVKAKKYWLDCEDVVL